MVFATLGTTPDPDVETATAEAEKISETSAILGGVLESLGTSSSVDVYIEWGVTTAYGSQSTPEPMKRLGKFTAYVEDLEPDTRYHYRAVAIGDEGTLDYGEDMIFTTAAEERGGGGGLNPWVVIGPILAALLIGLLVFFLSQQGFLFGGDKNRQQ